MASGRDGVGGWVFHVRCEEKNQKVKKAGTLLRRIKVQQKEAWGSWRGLSRKGHATVWTICKEWQGAIDGF